jgi:hypothetical protein
MVIQTNIPMVIQTIQLAPSEPNWTDDTPHLTRLDPTGADRSDADQPPTDLVVAGHPGSAGAEGTTVTAGEASA